MTEKPITSHDVVVHKSIDLKAGETLHMFTRKLSSQGGDHVMRKLNLDKKKSHVFAMEVFKESVVFSVFNHHESVEKDRFFAVKFTRKTTGDFEFGDLTEVERVIGFKAKEASITKASDGGGGPGKVVPVIKPTKAEAKKIADEEAKAKAKKAEEEAKATKAKAAEEKITKGKQRFGDHGEWVETDKAFWGGVL